MHGAYLPAMFSRPSAAGPKRWPRGQKFALSPAGTEAEASYRAAVAAARSSGRANLDGALKAWAATLGVQAGDGVVLSELRSPRTGIADLVRALEAAGIASDEVRSSIERLVGAGLVEPLPLASAA